MRGYAWVVMDFMVWYKPTVFHLWVALFRRDPIDEQSSLPWWTPMIRRCETQDFERIYEIINEAAKAYEGAIPEDRWHVPYMTREVLRGEMEQGVAFWGYDEEGVMVGVMGLQPVQDVALIRHAYVLTSHQRQGIGGRLLSFLLDLTDRPLLIGTWAAASWAVDFYRKHGFYLVAPKEKDRLLRRYWSVPERQIETSVVVADRRWMNRSRGTHGRG
jgi:GNAT superfamily N-acetyltransferase